MLWEKLWDAWEKLVEMVSFARGVCGCNGNTQFFTRKLHWYLHVDLHMFSTNW